MLMMVPNTLRYYSIWHAIIISLFIAILPMVYMYNPFNCIHGQNCKWTYYKQFSEIYRPHERSGNFNKLVSIQFIQCVLSVTAVLPPQLSLYFWKYFLFWEPSRIHTSDNINLFFLNISVLIKVLRVLHLE